MGLLPLDVHPSGWGTGVAASLLARGLEHLVVHGVRNAMLVVMAGNARARRFYERAGWQLAGEAEPLLLRAAFVPFVRSELPLAAGGAGGGNRR